MLFATKDLKKILRFPQGPLLVTVPLVYWSSPGVLRHDYPQSEAPVVPQIEDWKWMWVSEDNNWAVVVWCGSNPMLDYNGAFVLSRTRSNGTIPADLEPVIRSKIIFEQKLSFIDAVASQVLAHTH